MVCQDEDVWMPQEGERAALTMPKQVIVQNNAGTRITIPAEGRVGTICRVNLTNQTDKYYNPEQTIYWEIMLAWDIDGVVYESCNWISSADCEWWPWMVEAETVVPGSGRPFLEVPADELSDSDEEPHSDVTTSASALLLHHLWYRR